MGDKRGEREEITSAGASPGGVRAPPAGCGRTHVGDDGDEGVRDGEGEALRRPRLEALLHQREAVLAAEQADIAQQVQGNLHVLGKGDMSRLNGLHSNCESLNLVRIQLKKVSLRAEMKTEEKNKSGCSHSCRRRSPGCCSHEPICPGDGERKGKQQKIRSLRVVETMSAPLRRPRCSKSVRTANSLRAKLA